MYPSRRLSTFLAWAGLLAIASFADAGPSNSSPSPGRVGAPPPASALLREGFVLFGDQRGVKVYRRELRPGIELAAEGKLGATPERVRRVLIDYPSHQRWQKRLKENRVLARGDGTLDVYQRLELPVLDDRDFTLGVTWGTEGDVSWMRFGIANERGPAAVRGVVRVRQHEGSWRLEPADGGLVTQAVYRFHIDLASSFPSWMGKGQAASDLADMFLDVMKQIPNYR